MEIIKELVTTFLGDRLINILKAGTNKIADEVCHFANNKILEYLSIEYERNSKTKTILHRSEPVDLNKFYQPLFLCKTSERWNRISLIDVEKRISTENIKDLFGKNSCITIIGTAGSGKSTLVKYLFVDTITRKYKIPLKIELRYLNNYAGDLLEYIKNEVIKFYNIGEGDYIVEKLLSSGEFIMFFDGFDEISSNRKDEITRSICQITKKYSRNKYILTSRPFVNIELLENFHNYEVCDLSIEEIKSFIEKQFNETEKELAEKIIQTINSEDVQTYKSFLSNPLLLSMFIITYQTDSNIPQKRSDYYNQVFNTLYSVHDTSSKLGFVREKKSGLSKENFVEILKRFSFKSFFNQNYTFTTEYFENRLQEIKKDLRLSFRNEDIIYDLEVAIGILTQDGLDITYPHRSLQEYFAALFVTTIAYENKLKVYGFLYKLFVNILNDRKIGDNNSNFFLLLSEIDTIEFQKRLIIPFLKEISIRVNGISETSEVISFFTSINSISFLIDSDMKRDFNKEHENYNIVFDNYLKASRNRYKHGKKDNTDEYFEESRDLLSKNNILPFLSNYNYDLVISKIEKRIKCSERIDSNFIDSL